MIIKNDRDAFGVIKKIIENIECCHFMFCIVLSIIICIFIFVCGFEYSVEDSISFYNSIIGFGIASLSILSSHMKIGKAENTVFPQAVASIAVDILVSLFALILGMFYYLPTIISCFILIFIKIWTIHCIFHIVSLCLIENGKNK